MRLVDTVKIWGVQTLGRVRLPGLQAFVLDVNRFRSASDLDWNTIFMPFCSPVRPKLEL